MKDDMQFDDFIKGQFKDYSPDVPAHIWENIAAKRKSKPKAFWMNWFSGGNLLLISLLLLIGGGTFYYFYSSEKNSGNNKNIIAGRSSVAGIKNNSSKKTKISTNETTPIQPGEKNNVKSEQETNVPNTSINTPAITPTNTLADSKKIKINLYNNSYFAPLQSSKKRQNKNIYDEDKSAGDNNNNVAERDKKFLQNDRNNTVLFLPFIIINAREITGTKTINQRNLKLPDCPTLEKNAAGNKKYWEVYAGPDYAFSSFKTYGDTASTNYLQKRKASTKFSSAFSAGVRYTKVFDNGVSARFGLNYSQINEKFQYFNPNEIKYVTVITTRVVIRSPGDTLYINDTLQYQQSGTRIKTTYNKYRNIDIPVVMGYELGNGKFHANINAGVIINIYSWYKGDVLDSLYQPVSITTGKGNSIYQFKNNIGVGFLGSVSLYYKLNDNIHLLLEPYFRYNLSPMSKENINLQEKYNTVGLRTGLRFDLK